MRHLAVDRLAPVGLAGAREVLGAQPRPGFDEDGALLLRPGVRRREPCRTEMLAAVVTRERADRDRRVGRTEGRRPGRRDGAAGQRRHHGEAADVGGLALVGRHAERGVALEVLDRAEAFALGERDVVGRHVVLQVDECLLLRAGDMPQRRDAQRARRRLSAASPERALEAGRFGSLRSRRGAVGEAGGERHRCRWRRRRRSFPSAPTAGTNAAISLVPHRPAAEMAGEVHVGIPAAGYAERIGRDRLDAALRAHRDRRAACVDPLVATTSPPAITRTPLSASRHGPDLAAAVDDGRNRRRRLARDRPPRASRRRCW